MIGCYKTNILSNNTGNLTLSYYHQINTFVNKGGSRGGGGGTRRAPPLKFEKIRFFGDFSHEIPQKFSRLPPLGAIFLSAPPNLKSWICPWLRLNESEKYQGSNSQFVCRIWKQLCICLVCMCRI